ncbi:MAG TPA: Gldg family protein [Polyangiaceae bacterium]|nr:Gldg family protein [Polyangiaceae bacterium]
MAVSEKKAAVPAATSGLRAGAGSAPGWVLGGYLGGLVLVYFGERVLSGLEKGAGFFTAVGVVLVVVTTLIRFSPRFRAGGDRQSIESLLAILSATGLLGLVLYGLTTPWGVDHFLGKLQEPTRSRAGDLLQVSWVILIVIATLPMIFAETALRPMRTAERPESRRVRAAAGAGLTLALAAVYGALFVYAASSVKLNVDFSYFKTSRPSESTKKLAQSLGDPVRVVAFFPAVSEVKTHVMRYLDELKASSPKLQVEAQDRLLAPKLARDLKATQDGVLILSRGTTTQSIVIGTELETSKSKLKTLDRDFQEQLTKLAKTRRTAYITVGHGELGETKTPGMTDPTLRSGSIVRLLLQRQNYLVKDLGLAQGLGRDVPDDADVVLVLGPTDPFSNEEVATLKRYLDQRHGKLFLSLDADAISTRESVPLPEATASAKSPAPPASEKGPTPAASGSAKPPASGEPPAAPPSGPLNALAALVGLTYGTDTLANERSHVRMRNDDSDRTRLVSQSFSSHASVSTLSKNAARAAVAFFGSGNLEKARGATQSIDFAVRSPSGTFADKNRNYQFDRDTEKQTTYNLAAAVTEAKPASKDDAAKDAKKDEKGKDKASNPEEMRAFVVADSDAVGDFVMSQDQANLALFADAIRWLVGEESFSGPPNTEEDQRIQHTKQQDLSWFYATIFGAPGLVLAAGLFMSRRSRAKGARR